MSSLVFANQRALQLVLSSGLVPAELQNAPARLSRGPEGELLLEPGRAPGRELLRVLQKTGVSLARAGTPERELSCWAEALLPAALPEEELSTAVVLFTVPQGSTPLTLAEELLRLGCDRQELCFLPEDAPVAALLRAQSPPYYTLARAMDRASAGPRAFLPSPLGQDRVFTELGFRHPLADQTRPPEQALLLIDGEGRWSVLPAGPWTSLYDLIEVQLPGMPARLPVGFVESRLPVKLRLLRGARSAVPTLWLLRPGEHDPRQLVDRMVQELPEAELGRLLFAVSGEGPELSVLLRARAGRGAPPVLELPGEAFAPWLDLAGLFLPADAILEPPLRRETLRTLLLPRAEDLTLIEPDGPGFAPRHLPESSFVPLEEWVDYVIDSARTQLIPWVRSVSFEPEPFESIGREWAEAPAPEPEPPREKRRRRRELLEEETTQPATDSAPVFEAAEATTDYRPAGPDPVPALAAREASAAEQELASLEREFIESSAAADDPERQRLWLRLAQLYTELRRPREAGLCWTRALWEAEPARARALAGDWTGAEAAARRSGLVDLAELVELAEPSADELRLAVAQLLGAAEPLAGLPRLQVWLERHGQRLDVRSLWLGHLSLSQRVGGDPLQLARARDRIFGRLYRGLSLEHDVPTFLRFCGGGGDALTVARLGEELSGLLERYRSARRKRSATEAPEELTSSYVLLIFAYGFARLGAAERARDLARQASAWLNPADPVHGFLLAAYQARLDQAVAGLPPETPLPAEIAARLNQLDRFLRYKIDRLREASQVLEPQEHLNPWEGFVRQQSDPRGAEFAPMRGMADPEALAAAVAEVMSQALDPGTSAEERDRLFDGVMDFFPVLPEAASLPHLQALIAHLSDLPPARHCLLLEEALMLAGFFGRSDLVTELVARLSGLLGSLGQEHLPAISSSLGQCLRSLRRVGLLEEGTSLLQRASAAVTGTGIEAGVARLQLAAGLASLGQTEPAREAFREADRQLASTAMPVAERLKLTRAMAIALSHMPQDYALGGLARLSDQLPRITDAYATNSHFCLSVIEFMESLVLGYASEQLALGELGRRWLEEDEYLVRRRIHADLQSAQRSQPR